MTTFARPVAVLTGIVLLTFGSWWAGWDCPTGHAAPPEVPAAPVKVTIYDPDPQHLWNRLHLALWVRVGKDGKGYGIDRLDPLLWSETKHLVEGKSHEQAIAVLDEFLAEQGEKLVRDPLKRAILQRDLWAIFDWVAEPRASTREAYLERAPRPRRALQTRLARIIQRLALTPEEIKRLPDNYAVAVASRAFAKEYDRDHPEKPFLPPDLFQKDGQWVEITTDNGSRVAVSRHVLDFGARSAFRLFLRFPEGRKATVAYFAKLRDFKEPWVFPRPADRRLDTLELNPDLPQFPVGTQTALVRQTLLIDKDGRIATTPLTESVQIRVFRLIPKLTLDRNRPRDAPPEQDFYEFTRSRMLLFADKTGGLRPLGSSEKDFHTQLLVHLQDEFEMADVVPNAAEPAPLEHAMRPVMRGCLGCHDAPGVHSFRSYVGGAYPHGRHYLPGLQPNDRAETEGELTAMRKREQYNWGLLQGLWEDQPKK